MTRDEAIQIQNRHIPHDIVDILWDLGVLKLDPPLTPDQRINIAINSLGSQRDAGHVRDALKKAGFKIVEA